MARGIRNTIGLILAVVGAAAAIWAPFRNWYDGRLGHDFRVWELFTGAGITDSGAGLFASMFLPSSSARCSPFSAWRSDRGSWS